MLMRSSLTDFEFRNRTVTVMGLGGFGGGVGAVRFLVEAGANVIVTDLRSETELLFSLEKLDSSWPVTLRLGRHDDEDFRKTDLVVVSPAVPKESPFLAVARDNGVPLTSEMNLFWERNRGRVLAVTGSNGKSTTTALTHAILCACRSGPSGLDDSGPLRNRSIRKGSGSGACWLGGNIGISLLPEVQQIQPEDWVVLELSSFQLEDLAPLQPRPEIAVVTNFSPNHLDRHGSIESYRMAKQNLLRWQSAEQFAVLNAQSEFECWPTAATRLRFGPVDDHRLGVFGEGSEVVTRLPIDLGGEQRLPLDKWLHIPGPHNWQNAQAAIAATLAAGASVAAIEQAVSSFRGLPHRLEFAANVDGRRCFNDSKSTTPEATVLALQSFDEPIVLLAGGYDKQIDLSAIASAAVSRCRAVALLGQTGPQLGQLIEAAALGANVVGPNCRCFESLEPAVAWSLQESVPGDIVLLSPGCASYDWFQNYIERGEQFSSMVRRSEESLSRSGASAQSKPAN
ncbi:MAG: UDP-N-acetylmuramoyl-L-alanine--D-glutamate ligase [Planctomycetes bacterium]|nr:UDP-N-acetylmuramoyl-L-alanine--D-glutamate ligase [Planctomycetota bacterium]